MRIATVRLGDASYVGVVNPTADPSGGTVAVIDGIGSLDDVVRGGTEMLDRLRDLLASAKVVDLDSVSIEAPLSRFNRDILCTGWNYWEHFEESSGLRGSSEPLARPDRPTFFTKAPGTVVGPYDPIAYDPGLSTQWDYEAEIAIVIGRDGRSIPEEQTMDHVFGYAVANDISLRDMQRAHGGQWMKGKSIDCTMPFGPWITTLDEAGDPGDMHVECEVNGELMQDAMASQVAFSFPRIIAELSWGMTIHAGDVLLTGTPPGVGNARSPQVFLADGDLVVTRVSGLGELRNRVTSTVLT